MRNNTIDGKTHNGLLTISIIFEFSSKNQHINAPIKQSIRRLMVFIHLNFDKLKFKLFRF